VIQITRRQLLGLLASAVLLIAQAPVVGQETPTAPLKVLFIGNSYTSVNDLPSMVAGLAEAAGGRKIEADRHLVGGCTLEKHVKDQKAIDEIQHEDASPSRRTARRCSSSTTATSIPRDHPTSGWSTSTGLALTSRAS